VSWRQTRTDTSAISERVDHQEIADSRQRLPLGIEVRQKVPREEIPQLIVHVVTPLMPTETRAGLRASRSSPGGALLSTRDELLAPYNGRQISVLPAFIVVLSAERERCDHSLTMTTHGVSDDGKRIGLAIVVTHEIAALSVPQLPVRP
jgi:hypothetical protein